MFKVEKGTRREGTIRKILSNGLIVDIGIDQGIVFLSNISCQFMTEKDLRDFFYCGQKVNVIILGYDEKDRLRLGMKQLQTLTYKEGEKVTVKAKRITNGMECVTCDGNNIKCFISENELSWTGDLDASDLLNMEIDVKIISIDDRDGKYKMRCSLKQMTKNPWEDVIDMVEGSVIEVKVVKHDKNGISIVTIKEGLPGYIHKNQVTWLKPDNDITESDYPEIGKTTRVVVRKFQSNKKLLLCSIRDLMPNPWDQLKIGMIVKGKVIIGKPKEHLVKLDNGITGHCSDDILINCGAEYDFLIMSINTVSRTVVVSKEAKNILMKDIHDVKSFFKTRAQKNYSFIQEDKILLPQDIVCDGETIPMPYAMAWISYFNSNPSKLNKHTIISTIRTQSDMLKSFISIDIRDYGYIPYIPDERLLKSTVFKAKIEMPTVHGYFVQVAGRIGYIDKDTIPSRFDFSKDDLNVYFPYNICHNKHIDIIAVNTQETTVNEENKNLFKLDNDETNVLDDTDRTILETLGSKYPYLNKNNCNRINEKVYVCYDPKLQTALKEFLDNNTGYFPRIIFGLQVISAQKQVCRLF